MQNEDYIKAGKIAGEVREKVRKRDLVGKTVYEICEEIESEIKQRGAACAFPVNTSINEIAAHYTAEPDDPLTIKDTDLVKIDLGAQVNGHIADTAVTVCYDTRFSTLVKTAEDALAKAMSTIKADTKSSDVGRTIEQIVKRNGFKPIVNLSGHSLDQYTIHAGKSIPNVWTLGGFKLVNGSAYACEPFVTTKQGGGFVRNGTTRNIFSISAKKKTKDPNANELLDYIRSRFNMLPFALRWLTDKYEVGEAKRLLEFLIKKKAVHAYPVLVEVNEKHVAQAEHTFIPNETGVTVTTRV